MIPHQEIDRLKYLSNMFNYYQYPLMAGIISAIKDGLETGLSDSEIKQTIMDVSTTSEIPTIKVCDT